MDAVERSRNQDIFLQEDGVVVAATIAFGVGIDKPDVWFVCRASMPSNIESYASRAESAFLMQFLNFTAGMFKITAGMFKKKTLRFTKLQGPQTR